MTAKSQQNSLFEKDESKTTLDELFSFAAKYKSTTEYKELLKFVKKFRRYSPYNAMLLHVQMPGAKFVAPPKRWFEVYGRTIKAGARPLLILQPMGPVMFVFDVSDTEGDPLPPDIEKPFEITEGELKPGIFELTKENCTRDGISVHEARLGSQQAGSIRFNKAKGQYVKFRDIQIPKRYYLELNQGTSEGSRYSTLVHELAHLYCGHLGSPNKKWWPDRPGLDLIRKEFEAESATYMVCSRKGIKVPSDKYLSGYLQRNNGQIPNISLECVVKAAYLIEQMGQKLLKVRKDLID